MDQKRDRGGGIWAPHMAALWAQNNIDSILDFLHRHEPKSDACTADLVAYEMAKENAMELKTYLYQLKPES